MKNIDILPLSGEAKKRLTEFARQYKTMARIYIDIVSLSDSRLIVRVEQKQITSGKQLSKSELEKRVRDMFSGEIPSDWKLTVSAVDFDRSDIDSVDADWIKNNMDRLGVKAKNIETHTGLDKATLSTLINGNRDLTKWQKVAFYYFFKYRELSAFASSRDHI